MKQLLVLISLIFFIQTSYAQADTEFWFAAPDLQQAHGDRPIFLRLAATSSAATVTISIPANTGFTPLTVQISANSSVSIDLTPYITEIENTVSSSPQKKGIYISSTARITCYYDIASTSNGDLFALKGNNALGTKFTIPFQMDFANRLPLGQYTTDFIIVATENNTVVQINSTAALTGQASGNFTVTLQKGETYVCSMFTAIASQKPGGTIVTSNKPIAITTKDDSMYYAIGGCQDTSGDQLIPDRLAGKEFILTKGYFNNNGPDYYYIYATEANTNIKVNGTSVATLATSGNYYTGKLININDYIETDKPVQIFQISGFGCEVGGAVIPSIKCTGSTSVNVTRASGSLSFYVNVLSPANLINDFTLNGAKTLIDVNAFQVVPNTSDKWYVARINVPVSIAGTNQTVLIENPKGKFHVSVIHGGPSNTTRFGYFSDFSVNTIQFAHANNINQYLKELDTVCYNAPLKLYGLSFNATNFQWSGPNNYSSTDSFLLINSFKPADTGVYKLTATTSGCGIAVDSIRLMIDKPVADFIYTTNGCAGDSIVFSTDANKATRWLWDFKNGKQLDTISATIPKILFKDPGSYAVSLKVGSKRGCFSDPIEKNINLSAIPKSAYTIPAVTCVQTNLTFTDASSISTGSIVKWRWNLDDGNGFKEFLNNQSQQATYPTWGNKKVQLITESQTGCISDTFHLTSFTVNPYPKPGFISPEVCLNDANATFIDTTSSPDGFTNFTYKWDFNTGTTPVNPGPIFSTAAITQKNPSVKYNKAAIYQVKFIIDSRGCIDSITKTFTVNGANPIPKFDVMETSALCSNDSIRIINQSTVDFGEVSRLEIFWDSNDPSIKTIDESPYIGKTYAFLYKAFQSPTSSNKIITLKAYSGNAASCSKSIQKTITLLASPKVTFNTMPGICLDASARQITEAFYDIRVPGDFTYLGAGVNTTGLFNPAVADVGTHPIKYLFTAKNTCKDSSIQSIIVWPRPIADFIHSTITCEKNNIVFTEKSTAGAGTLHKWIWDFGDGSTVFTSSSNNPVQHIYNSAGSYNISLLVSTSNGCFSKLKTVTAVVNPLPNVQFDLPKVCLPVGKAIFINKTTITDNSTLSYLWHYGDPVNPNINTSPDGLHYYQQVGNYSVKLIATSSSLCVDSLTQLLRDVFPQPKAAFTATDSVCLGGDINFTDKSDPLYGTITEWNWKMGNGATSPNQNLSYRYPIAGIYTTSLTFTTSNGCISDTAKKTIWIHPYPIISAGPDLLVLDDGQKQLKATASGDALRFNWSPATYLSDVKIIQPLVIRPQNDIIYTLTVTGRGACTVSDDVKITSLKLPTPPNTFTPNRDGINDTWEIKYLDQYPGCILEIYNTVGQLVHRNIGYTKPWDGTYNGRALPAGTYYYVIDPKSNRKKIVGYVVILR
ncbi:MAG: PKD domain-containing protein [Sphingobacteriales bacterium]